jgi:hypothetical protein
MQDRDWTGTAAAVTALALTAGVWLWPQEAPHRAAPPANPLSVADDGTDDMARWRAEARRWDGSAETIQLSAAAPGEAVIR